jgi:hypothetical protein
VGLILGTLCETRQQLGLWAWVVFVPLLLPAFLVMLSDLLPNAVLVIMNWLPSVAFSRALRYSFSQNAPIAAYALDISILMFSAGLAWLLLWWLLRRRELK